MKKYLLILLLAIANNAFAQFDENIGRKAPSAACKNPETLSDYVCREASTEFEKVNAIYNWVTGNIKFDFASIKTGDVKQQSAKNVLLKRVALSDGFVNLFVAMCLAQNIQAEKVEGYCKDWTFDNGTKLFRPDHVWAAVNINSKWQLVDPAFGSGVMAPKLGFPKNILAKINKKKHYTSNKQSFQHRVDSTYFLTDAQQFRQTHLPADPQWQLTDSVMPLNVFEAGSNSVKQFNRAHAQSKDLVGLAKNASISSEETKMNESVERMMQYNPNYKSKMIDKYLLLVKNNYELLNFKARGNNDQATIDSTKVLLLKTKELLAEEKTAINKQYAYLKKRSDEKNKLTSTYTKKLESTSKANITKCNKRITANNAQAAKLFEEVKKIKNAVAISELKGNPTDENKSEIARVRKEYDEEFAKYGQLRDKEEHLKYEIKNYKFTNDSLYNAIISKNENAQEALVKEIGNRRRLFDDFDDEVIDNSVIVKDNKFSKSDSMMMTYQYNSDSINAKSKRMVSMQNELMTQAKKVATVLTTLYKLGDKKCVNEFNKISDDGDNILVTKSEVIKEHAAYLQDEGRRMKVLINHQNVFIAAAKLVREADNVRDNELGNYSKKMEQFDKGNNAKNSANIKNQIDRLKQIRIKK
jgi:hypothetical protein